MKNKDLKCGLTAEQWQQVIAEGLIVELSGRYAGEGENWEGVTKVGLLCNIAPLSEDDYGYFLCNDLEFWATCKLHESQIQFNTGVERPDWVRKDDTVQVQLRNGITALGRWADFDWTIEAQGTNTKYEIVRWHKLML